MPISEKEKYIVKFCRPRVIFGDRGEGFCVLLTSNFYGHDFLCTNEVYDFFVRARWNGISIYAHDLISNLKNRREKKK